jgi:hypothetical protein
MNISKTTLFALLTLTLGCLSTLGEARAQSTATVSDRLVGTLIGATTPFYDKSVLDVTPPAVEPILAFARIGSTTTDYGAALTSALGMAGDGTFNAAKLATFLQNTKEVFLTETGPNATTVNSDVVFGFSATVNGVIGSAAALISDPGQVKAISLLPKVPGATSVAETGQLQDLTSLLFPVNPPFRVQVASAVPEPSAWMTLAAGLGVLGLVARRRSRSMT